MDFNKETTDGLSKEVPYDLRQIYAVEILGEHLKDIARARKEDNFIMYFKCLKDVYIVTQHKFKESNKDQNKNKKEGEEEISYFSLMKKVVELANKYSTDWLGQTKDPDHRAEIEQALNNVEMFLYDKIEEAKLFGSARDIPGL